jgi:hypothetical protein
MMMTYPFDATIFENKLRGFRDSKGNITNIVGKVEDFDSKESFFKFLVENNITIKKEQIREAYIRYYSILPKKAKTAEYISENEGYTFCKQGRGASKVYTVELISM